MSTGSSSLPPQLPIEVVDDVSQVPDALVMYVIYERPRDFPTEYIIRRWAATRRQFVERQIFGRGLTLEYVRSLLPRGLSCLRECGADPVILETWL